MNLLPDQVFKTFVPKKVIHPLFPSHFWISTAMQLPFLCFVFCGTLKRTSSEAQRTAAENHLRHSVHSSILDILLSWRESKRDSKSNQRSKTDQTEKHPSLSLMELSSLRGKKLKVVKRRSHLSFDDFENMSTWKIRYVLKLEQ